MQRLISAICAGVILVSGLVLAFAQSADDAQQKLQGTWTATKAERDGNAADDVVVRNLLHGRTSHASFGKDIPLTGSGLFCGFDYRSIRSTSLLRGYQSERPGPICPAQDRFSQLYDFCAARHRHFGTTRFCTY